MTIESCPVCDAEPRVLVVMRHPTMLRFTKEILERECRCWVATEATAHEALAAALDRLRPDLLIIDEAHLPTSWFAALVDFPRDRVIVIGPEPDDAYRDVAHASGVGGWLARDDVANHLAGEMRRVLGCRHNPCPTNRSAPLKPPGRGHVETNT